MRLHRLTVSAFGPFAGTETVDFDELNDAGLFLLTGPTGAGKSSLLDAVCFALYGTVPGARGVKTLKSQHAAVDAAPEVVLDFTVRDRRFVVRRTPEWSRPKKRGEGLLTEKASASITETTSGSDHFLSARAAEVGLLVGDLMGMTSTQFVQVALLPQGEFQTFLRATSQERHDVLQHLFRTDRFARIEDWVHDHSRDLTDRADRGRSTVQRLLDSVADRADTTTPEELSHDALAQAAADGRVLPWAQERLTEAEQAAADTGRLHDATRLRLTAAVTRHAAAVRWREQAARRAEAEAAQRRLAEQEDGATRTRELLEAAERATRCRPLLALLDRSVADDESARSDRERALRALDAATSGALVDPSAAELADVAEETRARITRLETLLPREAAAAEATRELAATDARLVAAEADLARATTRAAELPADVERLTTSLRGATARAVRRPEIALSLAAATERLAAAEDLVAAEAEVVRLTDAHRDARDLALTAREHRQDLLARRLAGMAAELAGRLADGDACQVCGSTSHPRPATADQDAVTEADQDAAEREVLACGERLEEARRSLQSAEHRRAELDRARGGLSAAEARGEVVSLTDDLVDARAAADEQSALEDALARLRGEEQRLSGHLTSTSAAIAALRERVVGLRETLAAVAAELDGVSAGGTDGSLRDQVEDLRTRLDLVERTRQVVQAADTAAALVVDRSREAGTAADEAGFATADDARAALLPAPDERGLRDRLEQRAREAARVAAVLADTDAPDTDAPETDLTGLTAALHDAEESAALAARRQHLAEERVGALHSLVGRLCTAIDSWAPLRDESLRAQSMSKLVRGMGQDNQLQMRLSAYVLATRLDQVVAAANERLGQMRDQRYLLQRTDRAARKGTQAGLGLEIVDQWTGDARDPATLSGGETFVVSLSLALGLADVVTQEAGGTEIETLFVDEGFGTLDADTLDDVMDRLDGLRAGGRTVGVVSHVSELRNRIPTQVHVEKGRAGSTVTVATLVG